MTKYPKLAHCFPTGRLPDLRGEFIRGWDNARGADAGRELLSPQGDAMRNITGQFQSVDFSGYLPKGSFHHAARVSAAISGGFVGQYHSMIELDVSRTLPTAVENRPRSVAFNYIVRAA